MSPMIEVDHLTKCFGDHAVVDDVSFSIARGKLFGLLGPNGAGRMITIRALITLIAPTRGRVLVDDPDVTSQGRAVHARIGYVPRSLSADGALSGYEKLLIFAQAAAHAARRA